MILLLNSRALRSPLFLVSFVTVQECLRLWCKGIWTFFCNNSRQAVTFR